MASNIIKLLRSITAGLRPSGHVYGEPYVNFSDNQFGVFDSSNVARDLIGVPFFSSAASYAAGQTVNQGGALYYSKVAIAPGAFNPAQWTSLTTGQSGKNYIINSMMRVNQQAPGAVTNNAAYIIDQWMAMNSTSNSTFNAVQFSLPTPSGSPYRLRYTATNGVVPAGGYAGLRTPIEGTRVADLQWGTANAKPVTIQFGVRSSVAGTFGLSIYNASAVRCYAGQYTIAAGEVNTDVVKSVTIPGDVTGTWPTNVSMSWNIEWFLGAAASYQMPPNVWTAVTSTYVTNQQTNLLGTNGATFDLFDVGVYAGNFAPTFVGPHYSDDLLDCLRYWQVAYGGFRNTVTPPGLLGTSVNYSTMRTAPTVGPFNEGDTVLATGKFYNFGGVLPTEVTLQFYNMTPGSDYYNFGFWFVCNARL